MKRIVLTQGQYALVDDEDYEFLNQFKWCAHKDCNTYYATRGMLINGKKTMILMHHVVLGYPLKGFEMDHVDGQGLNNQRHNLRFVTHRQNTQNKKNINASSQYPGVHWNKANKSWMARIHINGIRKYLGIFTNERKAFEAYRQAVKSIGEQMIEGL